MLLLNSLFCLHGYDNRLRFAIINFSIYIVALFSNAVFSSSKNLLILVIILLSVICAITTKRRLKDAELNNTWLLYPCCSFLLVQLLIIFTDNKHAYWLIIIPISFSLFLLTYREKKSRKYILGYFGPIDLHVYVKSDKNNKQQHSRIEPTLYSQSSNSNIDSRYVGESTIDNNQNPTLNNPRSDHDFQLKTKDIGEQIRKRLLSNKKILKVYLILIATLILSVIITLLLTDPATTETTLSTETIVDTPINDANEKLYPVTLPDSFTLLLSEDHGVIVRWQSEFSENKQIWSQSTAQGDKQCLNIEFNNGNKIRTLSASIENQSDYFAYFSPLDTKSILTNMSLRNKFSLCGYSFSLKGSQAVLGKHPAYAEYIDY